MENEDYKRGYEEGTRSILDYINEGKSICKNNPHCEHTGDCYKIPTEEEMILRTKEREERMSILKQRNGWNTK